MEFYEYDEQMHVVNDPTGIITAYKFFSKKAREARWKARDISAWVAIRFEDQGISLDSQLADVTKRLQEPLNEDERVDAAMYASAIRQLINDPLYSFEIKENAKNIIQ